MATRLTPGRLLLRLERIRSEYGGDAGDRKATLLRALSARRFARADQLLRFHDVLCFLRAYPDNAAVLKLAETMLDRFGRRSDTRRHAAALESSGVAGTEIRFAFFPATACRLARDLGPRLTIDWEQFEGAEKIEPLLLDLATYAESAGLDSFDFGIRGWIDRMKAPEESDAQFLLRRLEQIPMTMFGREGVLEGLDIPLVIEPGPDCPSRTGEYLRLGRTQFKPEPLLRKRPSLEREAAAPPNELNALGPKRAGEIIHLAQTTMATRSRDLDAFSYADRRDVRLTDYGGGLKIAFIGVIPERRFLLETLYGFLILQNGVPVGYGSYTALFRSAEVAYTIFDTFRSGEAAHIYGKAIAGAVNLLDCDAFTIDAYQTGADNEDAVQSGAWWFYRKFGYTPRDPGLIRIMKREEKTMKNSRHHRSSASTLRTLASENLFLWLGRNREDVIGILPLENLGLHVTDYLAHRFGHDRREAERVCSIEAARLLGVRAPRREKFGEHLAWKRWAPLVVSLPGIRRWPGIDRRALADVIRAKGGRRESDYMKLFDNHRRLRQTIRRVITE